MKSFSLETKLKLVKKTKLKEKIQRERIDLSENVETDKEIVSFC